METYILKFGAEEVGLFYSLDAARAAATRHATSRRKGGAIVDRGTREIVERFAYSSTHNTVIFRELTATVTVLDRAPWQQS